MIREITQSCVASCNVHFELLFFSISRTLYLGFYYLWMVRMLLPVKKWLQLCQVLRVLLIRGFSSALKLLWQRSVIQNILSGFRAVLGFVCGNWPQQYHHNSHYSLPVCLNFPDSILFPSNQSCTLIFAYTFFGCSQVERILSTEQKATDYRSPDDGIAPDHRPTQACSKSEPVKTLLMSCRIEKL